LGRQVILEQTNPVWWTIIENARTFLSETPAAFRKIPNCSGGAGRKGGEGERNSRPAHASTLRALATPKMAEIGLFLFCFLVLR